ncbi:winged helix DNA-binding domain-containing protein [Nonomuraea sp. NPDC050556]|uniref:winged helix DNA-binding domain-containing protein n=1 Tax=Nonomuraea sp. NPDC050556 TaxID=3364369 RepID=UPI0037AD6C97
MKVTWEQIFAWRLDRQFVTAGDGANAVEVARRLCGVQAQVASSARHAIALRTPDADTETPLWHDRTLVKTWLMRGTLHLLPADQLPDYCAALATLRAWEKGSWQRGHGVTAAEIGAIIEAVPQALSKNHLTREELVDAVVEVTGDEHLRDALTSGWGALLKPLSRLGELCYGPPRDGKVTFASPRDWLPRWPEELPPHEEAGVRVARAFLAAHGPATMEMFDTWLFGGVAKKSVLKAWFNGLAPELTEVDAQGTKLLALKEHLDDLAAAEPDGRVHLLPGFDQYILGAPRKLEPLIAPEARPKVSRTAGWISPVVIYRGHVAGVWEPKGDLDLFEDVPTKELDRALLRLGENAPRPQA